MPRGTAMERNDGLGRKRSTQPSGVDAVAIDHEDWCWSRILRDRPPIDTIHADCLVSEEPRNRLTPKHRKSVNKRRASGKVAQT